MGGFRGYKSGFSLVEVMITMTIVMGAALAVAAVSQRLLSAQSVQKNYDSAQEISAVASALLTDPNYCGLHFRGKTLASVPFRVMTDAKLMNLTSAGVLGTTVIVGPGESYGSIKVNSMELWGVQQIAPRRFLGELRISIEPIGEGIPLSREVRLFMGTDVADRISSCSRVLSSPTDNLLGGAYSSTCDDFASLGWGSKTACLQDGRWHVVYKNAANGVATYGALADLKLHADSGASVRVALDGTTLNFTHLQVNCLDFAVIDGVGLCRIPVVAGAPVWTSPGVPKYVSETTVSQFYFTNGNFVYGRKNCGPKPPTPPSSTNPDFMWCDPEAYPIPMIWSVRY